MTESIQKSLHSLKQAFTRVQCFFYSHTQPSFYSILFFGLILFLNFSFRTPSKMEAGKLIIRINNVSKDKGIIWIGLYDSADTYLIKEKSILKKIDVTQKGNHEMVIDSLPFGIYAMALFHDVNANGEMDRNLLGIPSEPYAFSKKPKSKWRLPKFDEVKFNFSQDVQEIDTKLKRWWD